MAVGVFALVSEASGASFGMGSIRLHIPPRLKSQAVMAAPSTMIEIKIVIDSRLQL